MESPTELLPSRRLIIGITGPIGSGKTTVGQYLRIKHKFSYIRYSQVLAEWVGTDASRKHSLQEVGWEVMSGGKQEELNRRLLSQIDADHSWAVDGLRHPVDFRSLQAEFNGDFFLFYLHSSQMERFRRHQGSARFPTFESFVTADSQPVERQICELESLAHFQINNNGSETDLYALIDAKLTEIRTFNYGRGGK
jgi:AAA domain-containing protein